MKEHELYKMDVTIESPDAEKEQIEFNLYCEFSCNQKDYGNGYYVSIVGHKFSELYYDLRYDTHFNANRKEAWLKDWANYYWSGKDGAWSIKEISVTKA